MGSEYLKQHLRLTLLKAWWWPVNRSKHVAIYSNKHLLCWRGLVTLFLLVKYYLFWVFVCGLCHPACKADVAYLAAATIFFSTLPPRGQTFGKMLWTWNVCFDFLYNFVWNTGLSKKMDAIWNRYNLKSTGRIYTFGILKCSEKFKVLDLP